MHTHVYMKPKKCLHNVKNQFSLMTHMEISTYYNVSNKIP